jgi:hypothetical protein
MYAENDVSRISKNSKVEFKALYTYFTEREIVTCGFHGNEMMDMFTTRHVNTRIP